MPHICTRCNNISVKGDDILKGCPVCGWKKFLFTRKVLGENEVTGQSATITRAMGVRTPPKASLIPAERIDVKEVTDQGAAPEIELKKRPLEAKEDALLESIRITAPGTYELNLPSLFEREELIMAVKEGTYLIDLTSAFRKGRKE
jgi:predicted  nucleic acid-binding Zn-ribbon protein